MVSQLRSDLWCAVFVRRQNDLGNMCVIARRGDGIAGQVFIDVDHLDGTHTLFAPAPMLSRPDAADLAFEMRLHRSKAAQIVERIAREVSFDPDLWVLGLDCRDDNIGVEVVRQDIGRAQGHVRNQSGARLAGSRPSLLSSACSDSG